MFHMLSHAFCSSSSSSCYKSKFLSNVHGEKWSNRQFWAFKQGHSKKYKQLMIKKRQLKLRVLHSSLCRSDVTGRTQLNSPKIFNYISVVHGYHFSFIFDLVFLLVFLKNGIKNGQRNNVKNDAKNAIFQKWMSCPFLMHFPFFIHF